MLRPDCIEERHGRLPVARVDQIEHLPPEFADRHRVEGVVRPVLEDLLRPVEGQEPLRHLVEGFPVRRGTSHRLGVDLPCVSLEFIRDVAADAEAGAASEDVLVVVEGENFQQVIVVNVFKGAEVSGTERPGRDDLAVGMKAV
jgi:hypothetical protein